MQKELRFDRIVIIAYRLPFRFSKQKSGIRAIQNSGGLVSAMLALAEDFRRQPHKKVQEKILWCGYGENLPISDSQEIPRNEHFDIVPVKIPARMNDLFYGGFCNDLIWPLFHYFPEYSVFNNQYYEAYVEANTLFCEVIMPHLKPGDFIWIHDYQLLLLPELIRQRMQNVIMGFFLHIPFPSFEVFRLLPRNWRESVIRGMLGADLIGFHTHDYTQHFIKSVRRTTDLECHQNIIYSPERVIKADAFPIGIDFAKFSQATVDKPVQQEKQRIRKSLQSYKLIFSVDRLDYSKGLLSRLRGYETFLEKYPEWRLKVVFNMVVVPSRDGIDKYREMKREIESMVGRINGKYSTLAWRPVIYQYKSLSFHELVALYDMSDVGLITPIRDGMNLVAKEFVACQQEKTGVLILSEMAGAAAELNEALIINPVDNHEMADAIFTALEMKDTERSARLDRMKKRICSYDVFAWALDFFDQLVDIKTQQAVMSVKTLNKDIIDRICQEYREAGRRILFLDYDGTLVNFVRYPELLHMDKVTLELLGKLASDIRNQVVIVSGREKKYLESELGSLPVTLVAEHGYFIRKPGGEWVTTVSSDAQWKEIVIPILQEYVNRCHGTFIEEKTGSLAWHYRNTDMDYAELRLHELRDDLSEIIRQKTDFAILEGYKVLEVKSGKFDKGQAAAALLAESYYDFILAAGDDKTDEPLFQNLPDSAYSIRVGLSPSFARYNVKDTGSLRALLGDLQA